MFTTFFYSNITHPFGRKPDNSIQVTSGDVFQCDPENRRAICQTIKTSQLKYVKRITKEQAEQVETHYFNKYYQPPTTYENNDDDDLDEEDYFDEDEELEDERDDEEESDEEGEDERAAECKALTDSDDEPVTESFL
jgi:hypothetical protein